MTQEQIFASRLEAVRKTAKEQGNCISEDQIREAFADMNFDDEQFQMVFEYLKNQKIGIGEPVNPDDYLTSEEISYLDSYLESLSMLESYSEGVKEAITLSAMAGDSDAKSKLIEIFLPQVVDVARLYAGQGVLLEDLIGEGNVALTIAVEMLSTAESVAEAHGLIGSMIMESMENYIDETASEKEKGEKTAERVNDVAEQARELAESLGRKVTIQELADETGMTIYDIEEVVRISGDNIEDIDSSGRE